MAFKQFFAEKFDFKKPSLPFSVDWKQISPNIWRTTFAYDDAGVVSAQLKKNSDAYDVNAEYIEDPYGMESALADVAHEYVGRIKSEPYWWIDFESRNWGTETSSKEGATARNARLILKTVIGILAEKIPVGDNISFTSGASQQSKISLYTLLANLLAKEYNKKVDVLPYEEEIYFFVH
jgi:hypothetical protein